MNDLQTEIENVKIYCNCKSNIAGLNCTCQRIDSMESITNLLQWYQKVTGFCHIPNVFTMTLIDSNNE